MYLEPCQRLNLLLLWPSFQPWSMQSWQMLEFWIIHLLFKKTHGTSSCCSVIQSCPTFCDPMDCSTPGFSVLLHLLELARTHFHWISDAIQPPHPLSSPSPPVFNLAQHQSSQMSQFFTPGGQSIAASASASVLPMNIQDWFPLGLTDWVSL